MTTAQIVTVVITVLVPVVTAVAGILGVMFQDWRVRRSQAGRRRLTLEDARRQVTFAAEWWNAKKLLADSPEAMQEATACAATWLDQAFAGVSLPEMPVAEEKRRITFRRLLLFYPLQGISANTIRGTFYLLLGVLIVGVGATVSDILESPNYVIKDDLELLIALALAALVFRFWAVFAQKEKRRSLRPQIIRHTFLFYRLGGLTASLVRIAFYAYIVLIITFLSRNIVWNDPRQFPHYIAWIIAFAGIAIGLRHWAVSLGTVRKTDKLRRQPSSDTPIQVTDSSPVGDSWQPVPDHGPDHKFP